MTMPKPQPAVTVRPAQAADVDAIQRIYAHHVKTGTASFEEIAPDANAIAARLQAVLDAGAPYLVAERDGDILGFAYASSFRPRSAYRHTVEDSIYVSPDATGQGLGTQLLEALIERCTDLGYRQMVAVIGGADNAASIKLHERHGFAKAGHLKATGFKFGGWVDTIIMQRALGAGDQTLPE